MRVNTEKSDDAGFFHSENDRVYYGYIVTVTNLRRHKNAVHLLCTTIDGYNVIVADTCRIGQRMVFFPVGGQMDEEFARENHLLRGDITGNQTGIYLHPVKRHIAAFHRLDEVSEGLALPIKSLEKYTNIHSLKDGARIIAPGGHPICSTYLSDEMVIDVRNRTLVRYHRKRDSSPIVYIPWGTEVIESGAFLHCHRITEVIIPETVSVIKSRAFYDCPRLQKAVIPDSVISIGEEAFAHCPELSTIKLPEKLKHEEERILSSNDFVIEDGKLVKYNGSVPIVSLPEGITEIGDSAFYGNCAIQRVIIPAGVTRIGNWAFKQCKRLRKVSIPESVKWIGTEAFLNCKGLREVSIPSSVESIGDHAFGVYFHFWHEKGYHFPLEEYRKYKGFRIFCVKGSTAELYAWENHLTCFS